MVALGFITGEEVKSMIVSHYLMFNRNCAEALDAYVNAFGGKITGIHKYSDMPPDPSFPVPEDDKDLVLNATLQIGDMEIMCADSQRVTGGDIMYVSVTSPDTALVQRAWDALKQDGEIYMELAPSFFAELHGSLKDRFGINWMFSAMK